MPVAGVEVKEGKSTVLNITLVSENDESSTAAPNPESSTDTSASSKNSGSTDDSSNNGASDKAADLTVQPQDFRHHYNSDMELFLKKFSSEYSSITHLYSIGKSVQGRLLWVMEISDNPGVHELGTSLPFYGIFIIIKKFMTASEVTVNTVWCRSSTKWSR